MSGIVQASPLSRVLIQTARPKCRQRLNPRPRPPCCIFRGFEYASGYRGRQFDTGQHCFWGPIISAPQFRQFVPQGTNLSLSLLYLSIPLLLRPLCRYRRQGLKLPFGANSLRAIERNGTRNEDENIRDDMALRGAVNA